MLSRYFNRELSFLQFNKRILDQALNKDNPLLERVKFFSIVSSNLDEFFIIRVAYIKKLIKIKSDELDLSGLNPLEQFQNIKKSVLDLRKVYYNSLDGIFNELAQHSIKYYPIAQWEGEIKKYLFNYFVNELLPLITPLRLEKNSVENIKNINPVVAFLLEKDEKEYISIIQITNQIQRLVFIPYKDKLSFVLVEDVIKEFSQELFSGYKILDKAVFQILRDGDIDANEEHNDFISEMERLIKDRNFSKIIRLDIDNPVGKIKNILVEELKIDSEDIYTSKIIDLSFFMKLGNINGFEYLKFSENVPINLFPQNEDIWDTVKKQDVLLHLPYMSFSFVLNMLEVASTDKDVVSIKITLYRVSNNSPIIQHLKRAISNGKQVIILFEIKARFDESNNIEWANVLQKSGAIVIYGIKNLKVHAKSFLILRRENGIIKKYAHLSTGNYNDKTAKLYTDLSLITCSDAITYEVSLFFNLITGYSDARKFDILNVSPYTLKDKLISLIDREIENAKNSQTSLIMMKLNSINDKDIIDKLYEASDNNVKIYLNVRGVCTLVPNENIVVNSIVGRYLEHARIFYFYASGNKEIYLSSADCMVRNLDKRIELMFPIKDEKLKMQIKNILDTSISDNVGSYILRQDGEYQKSISLHKPINSQKIFYENYLQQINQNQDILQVRKYEN